MGFTLGLLNANDPPFTDECTLVGTVANTCVAIRDLLDLAFNGNTASGAFWIFNEGSCARTSGHLVVYIADDNNLNLKFNISDETSLL